MRSEYLFPTVLIALDVGAAIVYAKVCNWRMMIYWLAAATLTACVTYTGGEARNLQASRSRSGWTAWTRPTTASRRSATTDAFAANTGFTASDANADAAYREYLKEKEEHARLVAKCMGGAE